MITFSTAASLLFVILWLLILAPCWKPRNTKKTPGVEPDEPWPRRMGSNPRPNYPMPPAPPNPPPPPGRRGTCACRCKCRGEMPQELEDLCAQLPAHAAMLVRRSWEGQ